jgi:hypothetical protein
MPARGTRGAYRKEDRVQLPANLQKELVEKAAARCGNCQELARHLNIPKSSVHYYRSGRLTMPVSVLDEMLRIANDDTLREKIESRGVTKDRSWATEYAQDIFREMCRERVRLPTKEELLTNDVLRRNAAAIVSYMLAEGSIWLQKKELGEHAANITFGIHETDLYNHFRDLCRDVFQYDIGPPQSPGNGAEAIRGFIYSRFVCEWLVHNGVSPGEKSSKPLRLPDWIRDSRDSATLISALQPWCDGEGSATAAPSSMFVRFILSQSRHTDLNVADVPLCLLKSGRRSIGLWDIKNLVVNEMPISDYLSVFCRSEVFDDVAAIFRRLGFHPRHGISGLRLKDDGFWSCLWTIRFSPSEAQELVKRHIIIQRNKVEKITKASTY